MGAGSVAADAELDALKETAEAQILNAANLIGQYGKIVMSFCHNRWGSSVHQAWPELPSSLASMPDCNLPKLSHGMMWSPHISG